MCMCAILAHCQYVINLGFLDSLTPQVIASNAAIKESGLSPEHINSVCIGNVLSASAPDAPYLSRHVALKCGLPVPTPALIGTYIYYKSSSKGGRNENDIISQLTVYVAPGSKAS